MRNPDNVFHLAIPCGDLDEAVEFYVTMLGCKLGRRYPDRITLNVFGDQVVCHLAPDKIDLTPDIYPRHFGVTFRERKDFDAVLDLVKLKGMEFFQKPMFRFKGKPEEHLTFFLKDPSNNLIEFKHYQNPDMMY